MQVSQITKDANTAVLTVTVGEAELGPIRQHVISHFVRDVKIPGFRPGKAPMELVEKHVDQQRFLNEFMEHAVNELYYRAIVEQKLRVVAPPQIEISKFVPFTTLEFKATVTFVKIFKVADYKKIRADKPSVNVTTDDIDEVLKSIQLRAAERTAVERPAKSGDELVIDFSGKDSKGQPVSGTNSKDFPTLLGSKSFIPGFENNLIGLKVGEAKKFTIPFPKDYGIVALRDKKVTFSVKVKTVNELILPKIDDALTAKVSPFRSITELKADIKKQLLTERQMQADRELESRIVAQIVEKSDLTIPKALVEEQVVRMEEDEKRNLTGRGMTWQEHLKAEGINEEQHRDRHRPDAERNIKAGILLGEIAEVENIQVSPEELSIRLQILKERYTDPATKAEFDKPEVQRDVRARLLTEKTLAKLVDYAAG